MTTVDCITALFCRVDEVMRDTPKHPQARLYPSEVVTLSLLCVLKGGGERAFYRWLERDYRPLFRACPRARACSPHTRGGPIASWRSRPSSASPTAMVWS